MTVAEVSVYGCSNSKEALKGLLFKPHWPESRCVQSALLFESDCRHLLRSKQIQSLDDIPLDRQIAAVRFDDLITRDIKYIDHALALGIFGIVITKQMAKIYAQLDFGYYWEQLAKLPPIFIPKEKINE
jgi:hypothetical protein